MKIGLVLCAIIIGLSACKSEKDEEPKWKVKYEYPVFIASNSRLEFNSIEPVQVSGIENGESNHALRIFQFVNENAKSLVDSLKRSDYPELLEIDHKLEFVKQKGEVKDGFLFVLYSTEDKDCVHFLKDLVRLTEKKLDEVIHKGKSKQIEFIDAQLDSIKSRLKKYVEMPVEEVDDREFSALEKMYTLLLEKKTTIEISRLSRGSYFYHIQMMPEKVEL